MADIAHAEMVSRLVKPGQTIVDEMTSERAHMIHMIMGMSGEIGELLDAIKKHVIYGKELDIAHVIEELGDLEFYTEGLRRQLGLDREVILAYNVKKLARRYGHDFEYTDGSAIARADKDEE